MAQVLDSTAVVRETVDAFNANDWDRFAAVLSPDSVYDELGTARHVEGRDAIVELNKEWKRAFPDATGTIERVVEAADGTVTLEVTWRGHQTGPLSGPKGEIPPTGREVTVKAAQVFDIREGQVVSDHHYFDMAGMFAQLGLN